jgi:hypothetical protein
VRPEGLFEGKTPVITLGKELAIIRFVAQCPNQLCHSVPEIAKIVIYKSRVIKKN